MPTTDEHIIKAEHNKKFLNTLDLETTEFTDWYVIILFYIAIHYIDAYLYKSFRCNPADHELRNNRQSQVKLIERSTISLATRVMPLAPQR